jgi:hypothetical protein
VSSLVNCLDVWVFRLRVAPGETLALSWFDGEGCLLAAQEFAPGEHTVPVWPGAQWWQVTQLTSPDLGVHSALGTLEGW